MKKITDLSYQNADKSLLPRFILSNKHEYFDLLFSLLDNDDPVSLEAWNLIQSLSTSPEIYEKILKLNIKNDANGNPDWEDFIGTKSIYKLLYIFQIIESLIEEGGDSQD